MFRLVKLYLIYMETRCILNRNAAIPASFIYSLIQSWLGDQYDTSCVRSYICMHYFLAAHVIAKVPEFLRCHCGAKGVVTCSQPFKMTASHSSLSAPSLPLCGPHSPSLCSSSSPHPFAGGRLWLIDVCWRGWWHKYSSSATLRPLALPGLPMRSAAS